MYSLARWRIGRDQPKYKAIAEAKTTTARTDALAGLVENLDLPQFVRLADGDNRLLLDLKNSLCLSALSYQAARRPSLSLEEALPEDLEGCVVGPEGKYRNEMILPLVRSKSRAPDRRPTKAHRRKPSSRSVRRVFPPGGDWVYLKLYVAPGSADRLLREAVAPLAALHEEMVPDEPWFFIRYSDPEPHLRVRFRGGRGALHTLDEKAAEVLKPLVDAGSLHRVTRDTYVREIERYGGDRGIELAERWFCADSTAALRVLKLLDGEAEEGLRWKAVAMGFDRLLADFGLDYEHRERVVTGARESFGREFHVGAAVRQRLAKRLRSERKAVEAVVTEVFQSGSPFAELDGAFGERSADAAEIVSEFRRLDEAQGLGCSLDELLRSLTHMHANRMLPSSARAHELVIHDFLSRTYRSLRARTQR